MLKLTAHKTFRNITATKNDKEDSDSTPIFTISSNDINDKEIDTSSIQESIFHTTRKWTQVMLTPPETPFLPL